jgi:hypothetical protein
MAVTLNRCDRFPVGVSVGAYPANAKRFEGPPAGAAVESHTVASDGSCGPFTELAAGTAYVAYALVGSAHRYVAFSTATWSPPGNLRERIAARRTALGV